LRHGFPKQPLTFSHLHWLNTTSAFNGKGKKTAWQAWGPTATEEVTDTFVAQVHRPFEPLELGSDHFQKLERLVVIMYDRTSPLTSVNAARQEYGRLAQSHSKWSLPHRNLPGRRWQPPGNQFGPQFLKFLMLAGS
jgi:hypothetical protein